MKKEVKKRGDDGKKATWIVAITGLITAIAALVSAIATLIMAMK